MKLLYCTACLDVFSLDIAHRKMCQCGRVYGEYRADGVHAVYGGETAVPIGITNSSLHEAIEANAQAVDPGYMLNPSHRLFTAFVVPSDSDTFEKDED